MFSLQNINMSTYILWQPMSIKIAEKSLQLRVLGSSYFPPQTQSADTVRISFSFSMWRDQLLPALNVESWKLKTSLSRLKWSTYLEGPGLRGLLSAPLCPYSANTDRTKEYLGKKGVLVCSSASHRPTYQAWGASPGRWPRACGASPGWSCPSSCPQGATIVLCGNQASRRCWGP